MSVGVLEYWSIGVLERHVFYVSTLQHSNTPTTPYSTVMASTRSLTRRNRLKGYAFLLPNFIGFLLFVFIPIVASLAISFTNWDAFLGPLIYINSESMKTLSLGLRNFQTEYEADYGAMITGALLAVISTIAVYLAAQDFFVKGIATTGLKG